MPVKDTHGHGAKCAFADPTFCRREILHTTHGWLGNRKRRRAFYPAEKANIECAVMKDELATILEAMRDAQAELADYLASTDHNSELTIARLVGILDRREVIRATRLLRAFEGTGAPQPTLAEAS